MTALQIEDLVVRYPGTGGLVAVRGASLQLSPGQTMGLVGESGSGKTSLARAVMGLAPIVSGRVRLAGQAVDLARSDGRDRLRRQVQIVFQNPYTSLNPRLAVGAAIDEALMLHRPGLSPRSRLQEIEALLGRVGLDPRAAHRFPHQFSGGQRQRIAIARALATQAPVLILDEVTSALDVSVQATVINLLRDLQRERNLAYLFISHDLAIVRYMADDISVMYLGRIIETAPRDQLFTAPGHPYTASLIGSMPRLDRTPLPSRLAGDPPDPRRVPPGCAFHPRCPQNHARPDLAVRCLQDPAPVRHGALGTVACHAPLPLQA